MKGNAAPVRLIENPDYRDEEPQWSADGRYILFCRVSSSDQQTIWITRADGSDAQEVAGPLAADEFEGVAWFGYYGTIDWRNATDWRRAK